jgi:hypothetical protein
MNDKEYYEATILHKALCLYLNHIANRPRRVCGVLVKQGSNRREGQDKVAQALVLNKATCGILSLSHVTPAEPWYLTWFDMSCGMSNMEGYGI